MEGRNSAQESKNAIVLEYVQREQELMGIVRKMVRDILLHILATLHNYLSIFNCRLKASL